MPVIVALAVMLAAAGCSRLSFFYAFIGAAIESKAASYLDLDEAGETFVKAQVASLVKWHRAAMLPRYARYLETQADLAARDGHDRAAMSELRRLLDETVTGAAPYFAAVLREHTAPDKIRHLRERMSERQAELLEDHKLPRAERLEERIEQVTDHFERLMGDLDEPQLAKIRRYAESSLAFGKIWLDNRANRQRAFIAFLSRRPDGARIAVFIHKVLLRSHEVADPAYEPVSEARWALIEELVFDLVTSISATQIKHFVETLRGYATDMMDLSR